MPQQQVEAGKVDEAEEILDVVLPSGDEPAEVGQPCKAPLDSLARAIAAQLAPFLGFPPVAPVRSSRSRIPRGAGLRPTSHSPSRKPRPKYACSPAGFIPFLDIVWHIPSILARLLAGPAQ